MAHLKTGASLLGVLFLSFIAFTLWAMYTPSTENKSAVCAQVVTDARNPETGIIEEFPTPCDVPEGWDTLETDRETFSREGSNWARFRNDDLGMRFEYRTNPNGYTLVEQEQGSATLAISLFNMDDYLELFSSDTAREAPPAITVRVFENPENLSPREWVEAHPQDSNSSLASNIHDITLAGTSGVRYDVDGLYMSDVIILTNNGRIYLIQGEYLAKDSALRMDFLEVLERLSLY